MLNKKYLPIVIALLLMTRAYAVFSQSYTVIHTIGKIYNETDESFLAKGSQLGEDAKLIFETEDAKAAVLSNEKGRFIIQKNSEEANTEDVVYALTSVINPVRGRLSTRAGSINNKLDFQSQIGGEALAFINDDYRIKVSSTSFPIDEQHFFFARYDYKGEVINKKLVNQEGEIIFDRASFYSVDDQPINPEEVDNIKLFYFNTVDNTASLMTELKFNTVEKKELKTLTDSYKDDPELLLELLNELYGKVSEKELDQFLKQS